MFFNPYVLIVREILKLELIFKYFIFKIFFVILVFSIYLGSALQASRSSKFFFLMRGLAHDQDFAEF